VRHFRLAVILSTFLLAFAGSALADTVNMSFTGPGGNNSGGVYTYPYEFVVTPGGSMALICDAFDNEVVSGETWTATVNSITGGNGLFSSQPNAAYNYELAAVIFNGIVDGHFDANAGNWAIWGLFSADARSNPNYNTLSVALTILAANIELPFHGDSFFSNFVLYTPIAGTQSWGGLPQEYIGVRVPEPAEIAMLLLMLVSGLMGFAFRQRLGLKLAVAQD
jgi:hypothetical protein